MKVSDLIRQLSAVPLDLPVYVETVGHFDRPCYLLISDPSGRCNWRHVLIIGESVPLDEMMEADAERMA